MGIIPAGMNFWDPWPTWEKLTFVLGCCIFFVFMIGFSVKFRNARRLRQLQARSAADLEERGDITERVRTSIEVPFGIRAIEAGYEVDGIWNSRAATPLQAPSPKSFSAPSTPTVQPQKLHKTRRFGSESSLSRLELPESAHTKPLLPSDAPSRTEPPSSTRTDAHSNSITIRSTLNSLQDSTHLTVPQLAIIAAPKARRRIVIGGRSLSTQTADENIENKTSNTVERMQAHRRQLRAESGQLERRVKRVASLGNTTVISTTSSTRGNDAASKTISWPGSKSETSVTPSNIRPEIIPLPTFLDNHVSTKKPPPTSWTQRTTDLVEEKLEQTKSHTPTTVGVLNVENLSHRNENHRKVNDGFEVLPAGTLAKLPPVKQFGLWPEQTVKIVSEERTRPTRRLQKRNRSYSNSSRGSAGRISSSDGGLSEN